MSDWDRERFALSVREEVLEPGGELELELDVQGEQAPADWTRERRSDDRLGDAARRHLGLVWK